MSKFLDKMIGGNKEPEKPETRYTDTHSMMPVTKMDVAQAAQVLLDNALNPPPEADSCGARHVGSKVTILAEGVEALAINKHTGQSEVIVVGDYTITVERVK